MRLKAVLLIVAGLLIVGLTAVPVIAQGDDTPLPPITAENVGLLHQLRILNDVHAWNAAWSPAGDQLAVGTLDGVLICRCDTFDSPQQLLPGVNAYRLAYSPDGARLAVGTAGSPARVMLLDMTTQTLAYEVEVEADVTGLAYSPDGTQIAAGLDKGHGVVVLDAATGAEIARYASEVPVETLEFTPDSAALIYPSAEDMLRRQPITDQPGVDVNTSCTVTDLSLSPDGTRLLASTFECCVNMMDLQTGAILYATTCGPSFAVDFSADGSFFVVGNIDGTLHFIDTATGQELTYEVPAAAPDAAPITRLATFTAHRDQITYLSVHPDGTRIVTVGLDNTVRVFGVEVEPEAATPCGVDEIPEGDPVGLIAMHAQPLAGGPGDITAVQAWCGKHSGLIAGALYPAWSPDETQIAFQRVDPSTGELTGLWIANDDGSGAHAVPGTQPDDRAPSWSPDGTQIVFEGVRDGAPGLYITDLDAGTTAPLLVNGGIAYARPVWSPAGDRIAYLVQQGGGSQLFTIAPDGSAPARIGDLDGVLSANWSPDGTQLVAAVRATPFTSNIVTVDAASGETVTLTSGAADTVPVWSPDGAYIAFVRGDTLMIVRSTGEDARLVVRLPDTAGSTGLSWRAAID